jgi:hypothetical protein
MKCSECKEYSKEEHICHKCRQGSNSAVKFWLRHESDCIDFEIKDGDCLYYTKIDEGTVTHELKTLPKYFKAVWEGKKTFEVRKDDRDYQVGDDLLLQKYDNGQYLVSEYRCKITYILGRNDDEKMFVPEGYIIIGFK